MCKTNIMSHGNDSVIVTMTVSCVRIKSCVITSVSS